MESLFSVVPGMACKTEEDRLRRPTVSQGLQSAASMVERGRKVEVWAMAERLLGGGLQHGVALEASEEKADTAPLLSTVERACPFPENFHSP